jgi:hypothetical protein
MRDVVRNAAQARAVVEPLERNAAWRSDEVAERHPTGR